MKIESLLNNIVHIKYFSGQLGYRAGVSRNGSQDGIGLQLEQVFF